MGGYDCEDGGQILGICTPVRFKLNLIVWVKYLSLVLDAGIFFPDLLGLNEQIKLARFYVQAPLGVGHSCGIWLP